MRVARSVWIPIQPVTVMSAKGNPVTLDEANQATLFTIVQTFKKHRAKHEERREHQQHRHGHMAPKHPHQRHTPRHLTIGHSAKVEAEMEKEAAAARRFKAVGGHEEHHGSEASCEPITREAMDGLERRWNGRRQVNSGDEAGKGEDVTEGSDDGAEEGGDEEEEEDEGEEEDSREEEECMWEEYDSGDSGEEEEEEVVVEAAAAAEKGGGAPQQEEGGSISARRRLLEEDENEEDERRTQASWTLWLNKERMEGSRVGEEAVRKTTGAGAQDESDDPHVAEVGPHPQGRTQEDGVDGQWKEKRFSAFRRGPSEEAWEVNHTASMNINNGQASSGSGAGSGAGSGSGSGSVSQSQRSLRSGKASNRSFRMWKSKGEVALAATSTATAASVAGASADGSGTKATELTATSQSSFPASTLREVDAMPAPGAAPGAAPEPRGEIQHEREATRSRSPEPSSDHAPRSNQSAPKSTISAVLGLNAAEEMSKVVGAEARAIAMYDAAFARVLQRPAGGVAELRVAIDYHMENYIAVRNRTRNSLLPP